MHVVFELLPLQFPDGLLEQLHVHLEPERFDMPALLTSEQIARATNLEVQCGDAESAAKVAELLDRGKPLLRNRGKVVFRRYEQVGVRRTIRASYPAAQLV